MDVMMLTHLSKCTSQVMHRRGSNGKGAKNMEGKCEAQKYSL